MEKENSPTNKEMSLMDCGKMANSNKLLTSTGNQLNDARIILLKSI